MFWDVQSLLVWICHCSLSGTGGKANILALLREHSEGTVRFSPSFTTLLHQSGISSLKLLEYGTGHLMVTAGDDNAVVVTELRLDFILDQIVVSIMARNVFSSVHASNITSIEAMGNEIVTVSSDQRLVVWKRTGACIQPAKVLFSNVADMLTTCAWSYEGRTFVASGGVGLQIFTGTGS